MFLTYIGDWCSHITYIWPSDKFIYSPMKSSYPSIIFLICSNVLVIGVWCSLITYIWSSGKVIYSPMRSRSANVQKFYQNRSCAILEIIKTLNIIYPF